MLSYALLSSLTPPSLSLSLRLAFSLRPCAPSGLRSAVPWIGSLFFSLWASTLPQPPPSPSPQPPPPDQLYNHGRARCPVGCASLACVTVLGLEGEGVQRRKADRREEEREGRRREREEERKGGGVSECNRVPPPHQHPRSFSSAPYHRREKK